MHRLAKIFVKEVGKQGFGIDDSRDPLCYLVLDWSAATANPTLAATNPCRLASLSPRPAFGIPHHSLHCNQRQYQLGRAFYFQIGSSNFPSHAWRVLTPRMHWSWPLISQWHEVLPGHPEKLNIMD